MLNFILSWMVIMVGINIYLSVKKIKCGISNGTISLVLSLSILIFLNIIQSIFQLILNIFL